MLIKMWRLGVEVEHEIPDILIDANNDPFSYAIRSVAIPLKKLLDLTQISNNLKET
jgi:hypothetical protein